MKRKALQMSNDVRPLIKVSDVFNKYGSSYKEKHLLPLHHHKVMNAIATCRTSVQGGHKQKCNDCGHERILFNSCRDRHCPTCQGTEQQKWVEKRQQEILPVKYFHLVFTIPSELNHLTLINKKVMYDILFKAASETISMLALDNKYLGAKPGFITVLHTWGQNLMEHPHIHMIVTGGGITSDGKQWKQGKKNFFLPVKVMSKVFRGKFLSFLKLAYKEKNLLLEGNSKILRYEKEFNNLLSALYAKPWVVYAKKPFGNIGKVFAYLGKYTHRIAISNYRIVKMEGSKVSFTWKDYADNNKQKVMILNAEEFIRRFLLHVLPSGFFKIRYYGLFCNRCKRNNLVLCRKFLKEKINSIIKVNEEIKSLFHICPRCKGQMEIVMVLPRPFS